MLRNKKFIFLAGHHRSGTSLLHEILREHPVISGFSNTGVPEDEGQHLQSVYQPASAFGRPGRYIFNQRSYMNETHPLATDQSARELFAQWAPHLDAECQYFIEKSPPNLIRTRFLQRLFPASKFVVILRHPLAVAYATRKWSKTSIKSLVEHSLSGYEIFVRDLPQLESAYVIRYEDFVSCPQDHINDIYRFIGIEPEAIRQQVMPNINEKYFAQWQADRKNPIKRWLYPIDSRLEKRARYFGYSLENVGELYPSTVLGQHGSDPRSHSHRET